MAPDHMEHMFFYGNKYKLLDENEVYLIKKLWNDKGVKACHKRRDEFQLQDTAS